LEEINFFGLIPSFSAHYNIKHKNRRSYVLSLLDWANIKEQITQLVKFIRDHDKNRIEQLSDRIKRTKKIYIVQWDSIAYSGNKNRRMKSTDRRKSTAITGRSASIRRRVNAKKAISRR